MPNDAPVHAVEDNRDHHDSAVALGIEAAALWLSFPIGPKPPALTPEEQNKLLKENVLPSLHLYEAEQLGSEARGSGFFKRNSGKGTLEEHIAEVNQDGEVARLLGLKSNATPSQIAQEVRKDLGLPAGATAMQVEQRVAQLHTSEQARALGMESNTPQAVLDRKVALLALATNLPQVLGHGKAHPFALNSGYTAEVIKGHESIIQERYGLSASATADQVREAAALNLGLSKHASVGQIQKTATEQESQYEKRRQAIYEGMPTTASHVQVEQAAAIRSHAQRTLDEGVPYSTSDRVLNRLQAKTSLERPAKHAAAGAVHQGEYGDCFFVSGVASVANTAAGAKALANMIKSNPDGSYTVTFPGDIKHPVRVTYGDLSHFGTQNTTVVSNVIETAFLKYEHVTKKGNDAIAGNSPITTADQALQLLTGKHAMANSLNANCYIGGMDREEVASRLSQALRSGEPITVGSNEDTPPPPALDKYPLVRQHEYSVLAYDPRTEVVTVRNPWGDQKGTKLEKVGSTIDGIKNIGNGKLTMSLDNFRKYFQDITFSNQSRDNSFSACFRRGWDNYERTLGRDVAGLARDAKNDAWTTGTDVTLDAVNMAVDRKHILQHGEELAAHVAIDTDRAIRHVVGHVVDAIGHDLKNDWDMLQRLNPANW